MPKLFARFIPFILFGMAIVAFAFGLLLFTYLLIFGALIGSVLFLVTLVKEKFFKSRSMTKYQPQEKKGRVIEHE